MASKIDAFAHLLNELTDEQIAEMADVQPATVAAYRRKHGSPTDEPEPAAADDLGAHLDAEPGPEPAPKAQAEAHQVEPIAPPAPEPAEPAEPKPLRVRLKWAVPWTGDGKRGRRVSGVLAQSIYRGAMAERVLEIVGKDHPALEYVRD